MRGTGVHALVACFLLAGLAGVVSAQEEVGRLAWIEFQTPKPGMAKHYEEGRKRKAEWHRKQKDKWPLQVWEIMSGDDTGTYVVGIFNRYWKDFDSPPTSFEANVAEFEEHIAPHTESVVTRIYAHLPDVSRGPDGTEPSAMATIVNFEIRYGHSDEFDNLLGKLYQAAEKSDWEVSFEWYILVNGGRQPTYVQVLPRNNWADFADPATSAAEMIISVYGEEEARALGEMVDAVVEAQNSYIVRYRPDLSYVPEN